MHNILFQSFNFENYFSCEPLVIHTFCIYKLWTKIVFFPYFILRIPITSTFYYWITSEIKQREKKLDFKTKFHWKTCNFCRVGFSDFTFFWHCVSVCFAFLCLLPRLAWENIKTLHGKFMNFINSFHQMHNFWSRTQPQIECDIKFCIRFDVCVYLCGLLLKWLHFDSTIYIKCNRFVWARNNKYNKKTPHSLSRSFKLF